MGEKMSLKVMNESANMSPPKDPWVKRPVIVSSLGVFRLAISVFSVMSPPKPETISTWIAPIAMIFGLAWLLSVSFNLFATGPIS